MVGRAWRQALEFPAGLRAPVEQRGVVHPHEVSEVDHHARPFVRANEGLIGTDGFVARVDLMVPPPAAVVGG